MLAVSRDLAERGARKPQPGRLAAHRSEAALSRRVGPEGRLMGGHPSQRQGNRAVMGFELKHVS
jgi:hypothetical protein